MTQYSPTVIALAKLWRKKDKRLSWETCLKRARQEARTFGHLAPITHNEN